jgi:uncharacterized protein (DUF1499 family)
MKRLTFLILLLSILSIQGCSKEGTPNFQHITLPKTKNYYLVCPAKYCNVTPNELSPVYPVSAEDLYNTFNQIISHESRVNFIYTIPEQGQFQLEQKSLILGFPDDIGIQFIALSENTSTLAIYSKSRYGFYDFGVNKRRVTKWLEQLKKMTETIHNNS